MTKAFFAALSVSLYWLLAWAIANGRSELGGVTPQEPLRIWVATYFAASAMAVLSARAMSWLTESVGGRLSAVMWATAYLAAVAVSFVNVSAGGAILFDHDAPILGWTLLIAGLSGIIATWPREDGDETAIQELEEQVYPTEPPATAAESLPDPRKSLSSAVQTGMWTTVVMAAAFPVIFTGVSVFHTLIDILITGDIATAGEAIQALSLFREPIFSLMIFFPFIGLAVYLMMGLARAVWESALLSRNLGAARDLPQTIIDDIEARAKAIVTYMRQAPHVNSALFSLLDIVFLIAGPFGAFFVVLFGVPLVTDFLFGSRLDTDDFRIVGLSHLLVGIAFMPGLGLLGFALSYAVGGLWRAYGEHLGAQIYTKEEYGVTLRGRLARMARSGALNNVPRNPALALRYLHTTLMRYVLWPGAIMTAMGAFASAAILSDVRIVTPQGVEVTSAWSGARDLVPYAQARRLVLSCWLNEKGGAEPRAHLAFSDGDVPLFGSVTEVVARAVALAALDRVLRNNSVPVEWGAGARSFSTACVDALTEGMEKPDADRIRTVFRVDDWRGRQ